MSGGISLASDHRCIVDRPDTTGAPRRPAASAQAQLRAAAPALPRTAADRRHLLVARCHRRRRLVHHLLRNSGGDDSIRAGGVLYIVITPSPRPRLASRPSPWLRPIRRVARIGYAAAAAGPLGAVIDTRASGGGDFHKQKRSVARSLNHTSHNIITMS